MPSWNEVLLELQKSPRKDAIDYIRRKYLRKLFEHTGRNVIAYYSGFLQKPRTNQIPINDNDKNGFMTTVHSYTNDQRILDLPHEDLRRARAAAMSIIPTSSGAAKTVTKIIPELEGKIDGIAMRVPTSTVSVVDFICNVSKKTNIIEVAEAFKKMAEGKMKNILAVSNEPLVSIDYKKNPYSSIVDLPLLMVKDDLIKVVAWYDNE